MDNQIVCPVCEGRNTQVFDAPDIEEFISTNGMCYMCKHDRDGYTEIFNDEQLDKNLDNLNQACMWFNDYRDDALNCRFENEDERNKVLFHQARRIIKHAQLFLDELAKR